MIQVIKRNGEGRKESFEFNVPEPFNRGEVVGGFGFIMYEDDRKNKIITVDRKYLKKIQSTAQSNQFWGKWSEEMQKKTVAHRTSEAVPVDPRKVHDSFYKVQEEDSLFANNIDSKHQSNL